MSEESTENAETPATDWTPQWLAAVRADRRRRLVALVLVALVGLGLAWIHWLGLFVAGALVGLVSKSLPRAIVAGVALGVVVLFVQLLVTPAMNASEFVALTPASYVTVAAGVLAPTWGSLVRGVL
ncbi:hypothetical protein [Halogranum rubrum]|uniref:Uncharacterized protein n=1 Tax=Halogranum salarium B-1 TaxID=1210908 RepID=J3EUJ0_9EURY|nr:hypothetical protein [Halogranum salarium]EJN58067.1 hypothetical protein HSB1_34840 [Halogranum salarium B-1]